MSSRPQEEPVLVAAIQAHDDAACEELVRRYGPAMLAVARRLVGHQQDAQDAVQDAFVSAFRALPTFRGESRLSTWLHRIVVNAALMQMRRRRRHPEEPIEPFLPTFTDGGHHTRGVRAWHASEAALDAQETRVAVRAAIAGLPESYRTVLLLRDIEEYTTHDVAMLMGVTTNAVKVRLHRARQALVTQLTPMFGVEQSAVPSTGNQERDT